MRISKRPELTDEELFSPQQLFISLRGVSSQVSKNASRNSPRMRKRVDALHDFDDVLKESQENRSKSQKKSRKFMGLKKIIQDQKIKSLIRNFIAKLKRNNVNSTPIQYQPFESLQKSWFQKDGFSVHPWVQNLWNLASIFQIFFLTLLYTLSLVFRDVKDGELLRDFQIYSIFFYLAELTMNFLTIKSVEGRKLTSMREISINYIKDRFALDVASIIILVFDIIIIHDLMVFVRLLVLLKIYGSFEKMVKLENSFIDNFYKEQYWGLIKVFMLNFCFAHFLAIILVAMAKIDPQNNWITMKQWHNSPWYQIYSWSYYWATTIMLTVGFGDISATNYQQAICLTLIETFSCIALAYNINCVGNLINNIRCQDIQKNKNHKIFNKLSEKNDIPEELSWRINNYIEESTNIKKKFNFQQQNCFVSKLPPGLKADFLKQSNKKIFQNLVFFKNLTQKTLLNFAEKIEMRICHPEEVIRRKDGQFNILILKQGHIGFVCKKNNFQFNDTLIDQIKIKENQSPFLLSLDFINKQKYLYQMKSLKYSILYILNYQATISILQSSQLDYQHFCQLRDKSQHVVDEYEVFNCQICGKNHMKFKCPKLHYIPLQQHIIIKNLYQMKRQKAERMPYNRQKNNYATLRMVRRENKDTPTREALISKKQLFSREMMNTKKQCQKIKSFGRVKTLVPGEFNFSLKEHDFNEEATENQQNLINAAVFEKMGRQIVQQVTKNIGVQKPPEIWILECDEAKNYKFYFNQNNSNQLRSLYSGK